MATYHFTIQCVHPLRLTAAGPCMDIAAQVRTLLLEDMKVSAQTNSGSYFTLSASVPTRINPFDFVRTSVLSSVRPENLTNAFADYIMHCNRTSVTPNKDVKGG